MLYNDFTFLNVFFLLNSNFCLNRTFGFFRRGESRISSGTEEEGHTNVNLCPSWNVFISSTVWGSLFLRTQCGNDKSWSNWNFHYVYKHSGIRFIRILDHTPLDEEVTDAAGEVGEVVCLRCAAHIRNIILQRRPAVSRTDIYSLLLKNIIYINK